LVSITSAFEDSIVRTIAAGAVRWIGLASDTPGQSSHTWVSTEALGYQGFAPGEPDLAGGVEECLSVDPTRGWDDLTCGWPASGNFGPSAAKAIGYVCESTCGNGKVEPGEGCDPPGPGCTATCKTKLPCTEAGAVSSPITGRCFFPVGAAVDFATAQAACPSGTHLATIKSMADDETAQAAITTDSWIALRADHMTDFKWVAGPASDFNPRRFHGFMAPEPNSSGSPTCVRISKGAGWKDHPCDNKYVALCERE
jgi:hypothetical protein